MNKLFFFWLCVFFSSSGILVTKTFASRAKNPSATTKAKNPSATTKAKNPSATTKAKNPSATTTKEEKKYLLETEELQVQSTFPRYKTRFNHKTIKEEVYKKALKKRKEKEQLK